MDKLELGIEVDASKVKTATAALDDLAAAAVRAQQALSDLGMAIMLVDDDADETEVADLN